jgi:hypothetical protein
MVAMISASKADIRESLHLEFWSQSWTLAATAKGLIARASAVRDIPAILAVNSNGCFVCAETLVGLLQRGVSTKIEATVFVTRSSG